MEEKFKVHPNSTIFFINFFKYFGVNLSKNNNNNKYYLWIHPLIILTAACIQMILAIWLSIKNWHYINIRVTAFTKVGEYCICTLALGHLLFYPQHCIELFNLINVPLDKSAKNWNTAQLLIRYDANRRAKTVQKLYLAAGIILWLFTNFTPCILEISILLLTPLQDIRENDLLTSFYFIPYLTKNTVPIYIVLSSTQSFLYLIMITTTAVYYSVITTAIKMLEAEIKIFSISIKIIGNSTIRLIKDDTNYINLSTTSEKILKMNLKSLILNHQAIIK